MGSDGTIWGSASNVWSGGSVTVSYDRGSGFSTETLATGTVYGTSIAVDSNNVPSVTWGSTADGSVVRYAKRAGDDNWTISDIIVGGGRYEDSQVALGEGGIPYVVFRNDWNYNLHFAMPDGSGGWNVETAATDIMNSNQDGTGDLDDDQYSKVLDISVDEDNRAVIVYVDTSGEVQLLIRTAVSNYERLTVSSNGNARSVAVAIGSDGNAYIASNNTDGELLLAVVNVETETVGPEITVVGSSASLDISRFLDIAIQSNGLPVISFYSNSSPSLRLAIATQNAPANCVENIAAGNIIQGDLNDDCYVDIDDILILMDNWLLCVEPNNPDCI